MNHALGGSWTIIRSDWPSAILRDWHLTARRHWRMSDDISTDTAKIRNFSIIAHIDHGKSTLADRLLEQTNTVSQREMKAQLLDSMDLEREKGITIKARAVRMSYTARDGETYQLNLIDTPGHVDFSYEVSRSLAACEGALLVVDAAQGIEAQTMANVYLALEQDLAIVAVINKIDLPSADPQKVAAEVGQLIGLLDDEIVQASAKTGAGSRRDPGSGRAPHASAARRSGTARPRADLRLPLRSYKGVIAYVKIVDGRIASGDRIRLMANGKEAELLEVGYFDPELHPVASAWNWRSRVHRHRAQGRPGRPGWRHGDAGDRTPPRSSFLAIAPVKPMVFAGLYPVESEEYPMLRDALERLRLERWVADLGAGIIRRARFRLSLRLPRTAAHGDHPGAPGARVWHSAPGDGAERRVRGRSSAAASSLRIDNPSDLPSPGEIEEIREPWLDISIIAPARYIGAVMELVTGRRGDYRELIYLDPDRVQMKFEMPLAELIVDFYDQLKSRTQGYASLDYVFKDMRAI